MMCLEGCDTVRSGTWVRTFRSKIAPTCSEQKTHAVIFHRPKIHINVILHRTLDAMGSMSALYSAGPGFRSQAGDPMP
jgi:hypothetical protein